MSMYHVGNNKKKKEAQLVIVIYLLGGTVQYDLNGFPPSDLFYKFPLILQKFTKNSQKLRNKVSHKNLRI